MAGVTYTIEGLNQLIAGFSKLSAKTQSEIGGAIKDNADRWAAYAKRDAPGDVGFLRGQIYVQKISTLEYEVNSASKYAAAQEFGTKKYFSVPAELTGIAAEFKGRPTGTFRELLLSIQGWVERKGIVYDSGKFVSKGRRGLKGRKALLVAYPIALKISRFGVKPQPYFFKQQSKVEPVLINDIKGIIERLSL